MYAYTCAYMCIYKCVWKYDNIYLNICMSTCLQMLEVVPQYHLYATVGDRCSYGMLEHHSTQGRCVYIHLCVCTCIRAHIRTWDLHLSLYARCACLLPAQPDFLMPKRDFGLSVWTLAESEWRTAASGLKPLRLLRARVLTVDWQSTWYVPLSLARTWFVPLSVCDHSQMVYFYPTTGGGVWCFGVYSNKQTNQKCVN